MLAEKGGNCRFNPFSFPQSLLKHRGEKTLLYLNRFLSDHLITSLLRLHILTHSHMRRNALAEVWLSLVKEGKEHAKADKDRSLRSLLRSTSFSKKKKLSAALSK